MADLFPGLSLADRDGVTVVGLAVPGELTAAEAPEFHVAAAEALADVAHAILDLGHVGFVDSSGLSALVSLSRAMALRGGELRLARPGRDVVAVLELTRLHRLFEIYDSVEEAVASFRDSP